MAIQSAAYIRIKVVMDLPFSFVGEINMSPKSYQVKSFCHFYGTFIAKPFTTERMNRDQPCG